MINFRDQLNEDIALIQRNWDHLDKHMKKREFAFNYWVLNRLYDIDEEVIPSLITEYNDKAIDCYVYYEESKELYIIQNKYYDETTTLDRKLVVDFLNTPIVCLNENRYKKSLDLQKIFNEIKDDQDAKIFMHFYISNNKRNLDSDSAVKNFNLTAPVSIAPLLKARLYDLDEIRDLYYGKSFKDNISFKYTLHTKVRGNILRILPKEYDMPEMSTAFYMLTPVSQLYYMYKEAQEKHYPLFEENIREYLGRSIINKGIINTLQNKRDRSNFFYYNNGVTLTCKKVDTPSKHAITVIKPQIINGCQTVNTIYEVLSTYTDQQIEDEFKQVFVMVKILLFEEIKPSFYLEIVKYTNKQNSINESAFGAKNKLFASLQRGLKDRGFLLLVKPSDKNTFLETYSNYADQKVLLDQANTYSNKVGIQLKTLSEVFLPIDKLLQVFISFELDAHYAYNKKTSLLKESSELCRDFSLKIDKYLTFDNMIRLYLIYLRAERDRAASADKRSPVPYYVVNFLGYFIKDKAKASLALEGLFGDQNKVFNALYGYLAKLTNQYKKHYENGVDYNSMIKRSIDKSLLDNQIQTLNELILEDNPDLKKFFQSLS